MTLDLSNGQMYMRETESKKWECVNFYILFFTHMHHKIMSSILLKTYSCMLYFEVSLCV